MRPTHRSGTSEPRARSPFVARPSRSAGPGAVRASACIGLAAVVLLSFLVVAVLPGAPAGPRALSFAVGPASAARLPLSVVPGPNPFATGMPASLALGQPNLTSGGGATAANRLNVSSMGLAFNGSGDLWVVDGGNNRVLAFNAPFTTGEKASIVLGQTLFTTRTPGIAPNASNLWEPGGIAIDARGDVWVADSENNRVLEYVPPFHNGMAASLVLGQTLMTTRTSGTSATLLDHPVGLAFDAAGDLLVSDFANSRVLLFSPGSTGFATGMAASLVLGQASFTTVSTTVNASRLDDPYGIAVGPTGSVWVADAGNARAVEFVPPLATGMSASIVLGEPNFTSTTEGLPDGVGIPLGVGVNPAGDVWVASLTDSRVTEYLPPIVTNETPSVVLGEPNATSASCTTTPAGLCLASTVTFDAKGDVWVTDLANARVLEYVPASYPWAFTESGLPSGTTWSVTVNGTTLSNTTTSAGGRIAFALRNGSYSFAVGAVAGYQDAPSTGSLVMNGSQSATAITFTATILGLLPIEFGLLLLLLLLIVLALVLTLLLRRRRSRPPPPPPLKPSPPAATPEPLPPWHEGPPIPPPATGPRS